MCRLSRSRLFLNNEKLATDVLREVGKKRIAEIEPDGRQPLELARTKAWSYSVGNLAGLMTLARLGEHVDVDLWNYETTMAAASAQRSIFWRRMESASENGPIHKSTASPPSCSIRFCESRPRNIRTGITSS